MQRPFFSQSPKRVGSGPAGPASSRGRGALALPAALALGVATPGAGGSAGGLEKAAPGFLRCGVGIPIKSDRIRSRQPCKSQGKTTVNSMCSEWNSVSLDSLGVLRVRGADVVSFLQGQLSNDIALLGPGHSLLAGYHNPQGRVIALLRLLQLAPDDLPAILPRELVGRAVPRLGRV